MKSLKTYNEVCRKNRNRRDYRAARQLPVNAKAAGSGLSAGLNGWGRVAYFTRITVRIWKFETFTRT